MTADEADAYFEKTEGLLTRRPFPRGTPSRVNWQVRWCVAELSEFKIFFRLRMLELVMTLLDFLLQGGVGEGHPLLHYQRDKCPYALLRKPLPALVIIT